MTHDTKRLSQTEFIALMAMVAATVAFSIDAMLPALPEIGAELSPDALNNAQLILTSFVFGMGLGTFVTGPLSDTFGRKPVMIGGAVLYCGAAIWAFYAQTLEVMLIARTIQGLGAAGPRVVALAMIRDIYGGRDMARISSFVMLVFSLVPALAPTLGYFIIAGFGWRSIFLAFVIFSLATSIWLLIRQPETLLPENRRPLRIGKLIEATKEVLTTETTRLSMIVQTLGFGILFSSLSSIQQIFDLVFDEGEHFHYWFGSIAVISASASLLNARIVGKYGMRAIIRRMFQVNITVALFMVACQFLGNETVRFWSFYVFVVSCFFGAGMTIGNLNALAMEPLPHIAGLAASAIAAVATVGAVIIAIPVGLAFNGTPVPLGLAVAVLATIAFWFTTKIKRPSDKG